MIVLTITVIAPVIWIKYKVLRMKKINWYLVFDAHVGIIFLNSFLVKLAYGETQGLLIFVVVVVVVVVVVD